MPASVTSSTMSWGIYLVSAAALLLVLSPQLSRLVGDARESADWRNMDSLRFAIDSLRPGESVNITIGSSPMDDPIAMNGSRLSCDYGLGTMVMQTRWLLPEARISPGVEYLAKVVDGRLTVTRLG